MTTIANSCTKCERRRAFFFRPYSGERLCKKCFTESIEAKTRATIAKYRMFDYNEKVAVAVSGGKDSLSLLKVLVNIEKVKPKASLVAVTVDEGICGYRDEALRIAKENCERLGIGHHVVSFKELFDLTLDEIVERKARRANNRLTACAYCGVLRRRALNEGALRVGAAKIATAHTLDDEVQTMLMNIFRGDLARLSKERPVTEYVHPRFVQKVKPFCQIPEKESALYAYVKGIAFQATPCPYASEAMRNDMRVMLNLMEEKHPGTKYSVSSSIKRMQPTLDKTLGKEDFRECIRCGEPA
ncbi:TIGR00269 family protein, partial [Candidatus Woesearchaeota archaeon]|nr:TIGR00269 family protein [Candidatus Woesearchaeota archaeon]